MQTGLFLKVSIVSIMRLLCFIVFLNGYESISAAPLRETIFKVHEMTTDLPASAPLESIALTLSEGYKSLGLNIFPAVYQELHLPSNKRKWDEVKTSLEVLGEVRGLIFGDPVNFISSEVRDSIEKQKMTMAPGYLVDFNPYSTGIKITEFYNKLQAAIANTFFADLEYRLANEDEIPLLELIEITSKFIGSGEGQARTVATHHLQSFYSQFRSNSQIVGNGLLKMLNRRLTTHYAESYKKRQLLDPRDVLGFMFHSFLKGKFSKNSDMITLLHPRYQMASYNAPAWRILSEELGNKNDDGSINFDSVRDGETLGILELIDGEHSRIAADFTDMGIAVILKESVFEDLATSIVANRVKYSAVEKYLLVRLVTERFLATNSGHKESLRAVVRVWTRYLSEAPEFIDGLTKAKVVPSDLYQYTVKKLDAYESIVLSAKDFDAHDRLNSDFAEINKHRALLRQIYRAGKVDGIQTSLFDRVTFASKEIVKTCIRIFNQ